MKKFTQLLPHARIVLLIIALSASMLAFGQTPEGSWSLEWSDEFNGNSLNTSNWNVEVGYLNVNNELQTYTADRVSVGSGVLTILGSWNFAENRMESGRINSANKITWDEGYTEARIRFEDWDTKDATFAAFWSMGESYNQWDRRSAHDVNGGAAWPSCGENDIMEMVPNHSAISTIHYNPSLDYNGNGDSDIQDWPNNWVYHTVSSWAPDWTQWHTFGCEKTATELKYYIDGVYTGSHYLDDTRKEFHQPFFYILNVAIGGDLAGYPPNNYDVYVKMVTDYVRYYKRVNDWTITMKGSNNKYVSSNNGQSTMMCDRNSAQGWEKFDVVGLSDGKVALRGTNGKYVSSENGNSEMMCDRSAIGEWEKFTWIDLGNYKFALQGNNGKYVSSENGQSGMICNRNSIQGWETFTWVTTQKSAEIAENTNVIENLEFKMYPNPTSDFVKIESPVDEFAYQIYSIQGRLIDTGHANQNTQTIDLQNYTKGVYVFKVVAQNQVYTKNIIVK